MSLLRLTALGVDAPLGRARVFGEARYARVSPGFRLVPLSFGVRLR